MNQLLSSRLTSSVVAIAIVLLVVLLNAVVIINPGQAGVLSILGKAQDTPLLEGIHWKPPFIASVDVYDVTVQKFEVPAESATKDLQDITASFAINFRLDPMAIVDVRRTQGTLENIVAKIIAPQTQEAFKIAAARRTAEEAITKRDELKEDFDHALGDRLAKYHILVLDTSVVNLDFSEEFSKAVEDKQIAEQRAQRAVYIAQEAAQQAQAEINRARGKAEAQRLLAETLNAPGGQLVLQKEAIEAWREGGAQVPQVIVINGQEGLPPFFLNWTGTAAK
ncbi:prohibitin family protein [Thermosynechococcus sp. JY1334]|uniref:prohibitin family protein n=1 Tax=unclassified Thermosynechococcus TaxID=2622553 RepID=UPI002672DF91|nr:MULTISPECIES: prohibitin family protein [unclassified Thermosynechococcus]MDR7897567.1 prohibitin family protein [Thermosynechococcus sp. JY1332]MDR7904972.1 prohibitin family protein [Thermosynechococcus sp. JY1334]WKT87195.1 prohibitin family protein [Thermosynechococcus sp. JY1339]WNC56138.1 prohibitin family protein [Thermosynechococcus sp. JY1331]